MLVLTRSVEEQIVIGRDIVLTVTRIEGDRVRLGIEAPANVRIRRAELHPRAVCGIVAPELVRGDIQMGHVSESA